VTHLGEEWKTGYLFEGISVVNLTKKTPEQTWPSEVVKKQNAKSILDSGLLVRTEIKEHRLFLIRSRKNGRYLSAHQTFENDPY